MTPEQEAQLFKRLEELEKKVIRVNLLPTERENIKNALFEGYFQNNNAAPTADGSTPYLKVVWKNKIIYIPYYV